MSSSNGRPSPNDTQSLGVGESSQVVMLSLNGIQALEAMELRIDGAYGARNFGTGFCDLPFSITLVHSSKIKNTVLLMQHYGIFQVTDLPTRCRPKSWVVWMSATGDIHTQILTGDQYWNSNWMCAISKFALNFSMHTYLYILFQLASQWVSSLDLALDTQQCDFLRGPSFSS